MKIKTLPGGWVGGGGVVSCVGMPIQHGGCL